MENKWKPNCVCPICERHQFEDSYDICPVCFWENDGVQYDGPDFGGGANYLSLNDYKKRWKKLNDILPKLMKQYNISKTNLSPGPKESLPSTKNNTTSTSSIL